MFTLRSLPLVTVVLATLVLAAPSHADVTAPAAAESTGLPAETVSASAGAVPTTPAAAASTSLPAETVSASVGAVPTTTTASATTTTASATTTTAGATTTTASATTTTSSADAATTAPPQQPPPVAAPVAPAVGSAAPESSATTQMIWQVQVAGCLAHCQGGSQLQVAVQQATVTQVIPIASGSAAPPSSPIATASTPVRAPPIASGTTQVQLGCVRYCFDGTTVAASSRLSATAAQGLVDGAGRVASSMAPSQSPRAPAAQSSTTQVVDQWQSGSGATSSQSQIAVQISTTLQAVASASTLSALVGAGSAASQVDQGIWQLQVGCMLDCVDTRQEQVALQVDSSIQVSLPASASGVATTTLPSGAAVAIIWQLQIGCLIWCFDAVEVQVATGDPGAVTNGPAPAGAPAAADAPVADAAPVAAAGPVMAVAPVVAVAPVAAAAPVGAGLPTQFATALGATPPTAVGAPAPTANVLGILRSVGRPPRLPARSAVVDRSSTGAAVGGATAISSSIEIGVAAAVIPPSRRRFAHLRSSATARRLIEPRRGDRGRAPDVAPRQPTTVRRGDPGHLGWPIAAIAAVMLVAGLRRLRLFAISKRRRRPGA